ncbi:MAG: PAS domain S-box protein [Rhodocyclaceae bacterium]|nr:PAS domain S-box protein [Rhodocyclaceae bacterium]
MNVPATLIVQTLGGAGSLDARARLALLDVVGSPMLAYQDDRVLYANAAMEKLSGWTREQLYEMPFFELAHPEDRDMWRTRAAARMSGSIEPRAYEIRIVSKEGETRWVELRPSRVEIEGWPVIVCFIYDFTERKRDEARQRGMKRLLAQIIEGDPMPTFVIDADHVVTHWNKACATLTGIAASEIVGTRNQWKPFYPSERPVLADLIIDGVPSNKLEAYYKDIYRRSPLIEGAYEAEAFFSHFGEYGRWLYFSAAPLRDEEGALIGAIETMQDVTARHDIEDVLRAYQTQLEELVEQRTAQLEAANEQLLQSEKLASIGQLAAGVAHEINNPIGYVHSNIGTLEKYLTDLFEMLAAYEQALQPSGPAAPEGELKALRSRLDLDFLKEDIPMLMSECKEGITRVRKIIQDLKDFSRVDASQEWQWADLHKGIDSTLNIVNNEIKYKADVVKEYGEIPEIECLPSQLNQVFMNLLVNAAHAIGEQRGTITIRTVYEDRQVGIEVEDTGSGIPEGLRQKIFDPFFTTKPVGKGTGLGLSLAYGIIQTHGGKIEVESEVGKGTIFRLVLPVSRSGKLRNEESGGEHDG